MDAPKRASSVAPTKARIRPMRKLIRATMPSACGPHACITSTMSDQRNCARPRTSFSKATTLSPRKLSMAAPPVQAARPDSPTRCEEGRRELPCARRPSSPARPGKAQSASPGRPAGSAVRNSTFPLAQRSLMARMRTIKALSQRPKRLRLELQRLTPPPASSFSTAETSGRPRPIQPVAGDLDEKNTVLFPPSGQPCGNMLRITHISEWR